MELTLCCRGRAAGRLELETQGSCVQLRADMEDPGDGLYRAALVGRTGELALGVMVPEEGRLFVGRRVYRRDVEALGPLEGGEARCCRAFEPLWRRIADPEAAGLTAGAAAWYRRTAGTVELAIALEEGARFPLERLFCLAEIYRVQGRQCAVYRFDGGGRPLLPGEE